MNEIDISHKVEPLSESIVWIKNITQADIDKVEKKKDYIIVTFRNPDDDDFEYWVRDIKSLTPSSYVSAHCYDMSFAQFKENFIAIMDANIPWYAPAGTTRGKIRNG